MCPAVLRHADHRLAALAFAACISATTGFAQSTWIVDAGGEGDFSDLAAAFDVTAPGDTVRVRPGDYGGATLEKAIRLIFEPGAFVNTPSNSVTLEVSGIPAGQVCSITGLDMTDGSLAVGAQLSVHDCDGVVAIEHATLLSWVNPAFGIERCASVHVSHSSIRQMMHATDSRVTASECEFRGGVNAFGVRATNSTIELNRCSAFGGDSIGHFGSTSAVYAEDSHLVLRGDASSEYAGGFWATFQSPSMQAVGTSTLLIDPNVTLSSAPLGMTSIETRPLPTVSATNGPTIDVTMRTTPGDAFGLLLALPGTPIDVPPFGTFWFLSAPVPLVTTTMGASGEFTMSLNNPGTPSAIGLPLAFQGVNAGAVIEFTNSALIVVQ